MIRYCIVPLVDVTDSLVNFSLVTSTETLRLNGAGSHVIFLFDDSKSNAEQVFKDYLWYSADEIRTLTKADGSGW